MGRRCLVCQSSKKSIFLKTPKRSLYVCHRCHLIYVSPLPKKAFLKKFYQEEYFQLEKDKKKILGYRDYEQQKRFLISYFEKKLKQIAKLKGEKRGKLLDIGCALGYFLESAKKDGWEVVGLDISPYAVEAVRKGGVKAVEGFLYEAGFERNSFDVITIFQTIEHDPNPVNLLSEIYRILKPGGILLLITPDQKGMLPTLLGKKWHGWQVEAHLFWFDKQSLQFALKKAGFRNIEIKKDILIWGSLMDIFEAIKMRYPNLVTKTAFAIISWLPRSIRQIAIIPQIPLRGLSVVVIK